MINKNTFKYVKPKEDQIYPFLKKVLFKRESQKMYLNLNILESTTPENVNLIDNDDLTIDDQNDSFSLTEEQKLRILIIAVSLFFITLLITICIVSPCFKIIKKWLPKSTDSSLASSSNPIFKQYIAPETKSFQLTVVPQYVEKQKLNLNLNSSKQSEPINLYNNSLNEPNLKRKLLRDIFQNKEINCNTFFLNNKNLDVEDAYDKWNDIKLCDQNSMIYSNLNNLNCLNGFQNNGNEDQIEIIASVRTEKLINSTNKTNNVRLILHLKQIKYLPLKANGLEPSFYCLISGLGANSAFRKATNRAKSAKLSSILNYQSETFKPRTLNPTINLKYYSDELSKSVLKDGKLLIRVMAIEKHANDHCLGELVISLKQILNDEKTIDKLSFNNKEDVFKCYKLQRPKEVSAKKRDAFLKI